ncbi:MAG TPA: hypothetical protein VMO26_29175 [Vicinamibacterales bacterium]|nr:hypothetical protein [Vicinamibacterales bacterium]
MLRDQRPRALVIVAVAALLGAACEAGGDAGAATAAPVDDAPQFQVDPFWPKVLPNNWILGQVAGIAVDDRDHVWIIQRPTSLTPEEAGAAQKPPISMCCVPAPPVIEFDPEGNVVQAWGGPGKGHDWFEVEHGIHVDRRNQVWVGGNGEPDNHILKFSRDGKFLLRIGEPRRHGGSNDTTTLGGPAGVEVDPSTNEVYVADGYKNRRVIVFDADTGAYKRHWGAYGARPDDAPLPTYDPAAPPARQFRGPVHAVEIARDGLVYVTDRTGNRVQVFRKDGEFVNEVIIRPETLAIGSAWDLALSPDPQQRWLFVADGSNHVVWVLARASLKTVTRFGWAGRNAGQFGWVHNLAVDSKGNIYTAEVETGKRIQKFTAAAR